MQPSPESLCGRDFKDVNADAASTRWAGLDYRKTAVCGWGPSFPPAFLGTATRTQRVTKVTAAASERILVTNVGVMVILPR